MAGAPDAMRGYDTKTRVLKRIDRKRGDVFLRADFADLGGYDQVGRPSIEEPYGDLLIY